MDKLVEIEIQQCRGFVDPCLNEILNYQRVIHKFGTPAIRSVASIPSMAKTYVNDAMQSNAVQCSPVQSNPTHPTQSNPIFPIHPIQPFINLTKTYVYSSHTMQSNSIQSNPWIQPIRIPPAVVLVRWGVVLLLLMGLWHSRSSRLSCCVWEAS